MTTPNEALNDFIICSAKPTLDTSWKRLPSGNVASWIPDPNGSYVLYVPDDPTRVAAANGTATDVIADGTVTITPYSYSDDRHVWMLVLPRIRRREVRHDVVAERCAAGKVLHD